MLQRRKLRAGGPTCFSGCRTGQPRWLWPGLPQKEHTFGRSVMVLLTCIRRLTFQASFWASDMLLDRQSRHQTCSWTDGKAPDTVLDRQQNMLCKVV